MHFPNWTREPLLHFAALGAILYLLMTWGGTPIDPTSRLIHIGANERKQIAESWMLNMGRSPTDDELDKAIDAYVREEILYREALRLGLDEDDAVIRRRLASKMDLSASLAAEVEQPSDEVLRRFYKNNAINYANYGAARAKVSFDQILFSSKTAAILALSDGAGKGEGTSLPSTIEAASMQAVDTRFGQQFAEGIRGLKAGANWQGPIQSSFGWHLVRLREYKAQSPQFETLRKVLANDWRIAQINKRKSQAYHTLRSAYRIDIDR